jgi:tetratricopeptide (TPR) repeat protein
MSAHLDEAIAQAEDGLARFPREIPPAQWSIGVSPHSWLTLWRGISLSWAGRLPEGINELARVYRLSEEDGTPEMVGYAAAFSSEAHYLSLDAARALACAREVEEISRQLGEHPVMVAHVQRAFAYAHLVAGHPADAIEPARTALALFSRADAQHEGHAAALLAQALLETGDFAAAVAAAGEAIALSHRSLRRTYEAMAHGFRALALLGRDGASARSAAEADLAAAAILIDDTGARTLAPMLCTWRAELAGVLGDDALQKQLLGEAEQGYREVGAPIRAERLARELSK